MKGLKKFLLGALTAMTLLGGTVGVAACSGVTITSDNNGAIVVTPNSGSSSSSSSSNGQNNNNTDGNNGNHGGNNGNNGNHGGNNGNNGNNGGNGNQGGGDNDDPQSHVHTWENETIIVSATCEGVGVKTQSCSCGDEKVENIPALGHEIMQYAAQDATCTAIGWEAYKVCLRDGCTYSTYTALEALGHDYVNHEGQDATCTAFGWEAYQTCTRCTYSTYQTIEVKGHTYNNDVCEDCNTLNPQHVHSWVDGEVVQQPDCTHLGLKNLTCYCGGEKVESIAALGHDRIRITAQLPTCLSIGWDTYETCEREGCTYSTYQALPALGHDYVNHAAQAATCTAFGWNDYQTCTRCTYSNYQMVAATGHTYELGICKDCDTMDPNHAHLWNAGDVLSAPTCLQVGTKEYACTVVGCDETKTESIAALGHGITQHEAKAPDCETIGWNAYETCSRCDYTTYAQLSALGHSYGEGVVTTAATCETAGVKTFTCVCGDSYTESIAALGHDYEGWMQVYAPTCTQAGLEKRICANNDTHVQTRDVAALGHDNVQYSAKEPGCESIGWNAYEACSRCDYTTYVELPALGHRYNSGVVTTAATCETAGVKTFTCVCNRSYTESIPALGHKYGEWTTSRAATCETLGEEKRVCANDAWHVETRSIAALGHKYGAWTQVSAPTCAVQGQEKRVCSNNASHVETRAIATTDEHEVREDGICDVCEKTIKNRLATPRFNKVDENNNKYMLHWFAVDNAAKYEVSVNDLLVKVTTNISFNMEEYFAGEDILVIAVRAIPAANANYVASEYLVYTYNIPGESITKYAKGIGSSVNLLTGSYTDYAMTSKGEDTTSIFNQNAFKNLRVDFVNEASTDVTAQYSEGMESYLQKRSSSVTDKVSVDASLGVDKLAKVSMGYTFEEISTYETQLYNETTAAFYDMDYKYINRLATIRGGNTVERLTAMISEQFESDAMKVANGQMTAQRFVDTYGTHVMLSAYYGASLNIHYELLSSTAKAESMFNGSVSSGITAQLSAAMKGFDFKGEIKQGTTTTTNNFTAGTYKDSRIRFTASAKGGGCAGFADLSTLSAGCADWQKTVDGNPGTHVIVDVPDGALYCVWDFLDDSYETAKNILNQYFYTTCNENYYALQDKINGMYKDCYLFNNLTGTLTVNFAGLQAYDASHKDINISNVKYSVNDVTWFNGTTFTVYPQYNGNVVKKVIFKGSYYKTNTGGLQIKSKFGNFNIAFDKHCTTPIELEFDSFAYQAAAGKHALDVSLVQNTNITINVVGNAKIVGGNGVGNGGSGFAGIYAPNKNLTITGGNLDVIGGNGTAGANGNNGANKGDDGVAGKIGGNGGNGILTNGIQLKSGKLTATGGNGGNGGKGGDGATGSQPADRSIDTNIWDYSGDGGANQARGGLGGYTGGKGGDGGNGGNGGVSGYALKITSLTVGNNAALIVYEGKSGIGGNGGNGGNGGKGQNVKQTNSFGNVQPGQGGNGGNGGHSGVTGKVMAAISINYSNISNITVHTTQVTATGKGGAAGSGGAPGVKTGHYTDWGASWGSSGVAGGIPTTVYVGNKQYTLYKADVLWTEAKAAAAEKGEKLISINSKEEQAIAEKLFKSVESNAGNGSNCWIGLSRNPSNLDNWVWEDGTKFALSTTSVYQNWCAGEPNDKNNEQYGHLYNDMKWNDTSNDSGSTHYYMTEKDI